MKALPDLEDFLADVLEDLGCQTGTIHRTAPNGGFLELEAAIGVPEFVMDKIRHIPFGKGMAGAAAGRSEPVGGAVAAPWLCGNLRERRRMGGSILSRSASEVKRMTLADASG